MTIQNLALVQVFNVGPYHYLKTGTHRVFDLGARRSVSVSPNAALPIVCLYNQEVTQ